MQAAANPANLLLRKWSITICAALLLTFTIVAWLSFQHQSATIDEPLHAVGGYQHVFQHDYRVNPEDPPLWNYLSMLPHSRGELRDRTPPKVYEWATENILQGFPITTRMLYATPGNDGEAFVNESRDAMLVAGLALGVVLAAWAYRLAGGVAAIVAIALFCFDPNFLAHAPLIKNDVCLSLTMILAAWTVCSMGRRLTALNGVLSLLVIAAAPAVKFSGVLVVLIAVVLLFIRALLPTPWPMFRAQLNTRRQRLSLALGLTIAIAGACDLSIWACYAFRFEPTPTAGLLMKTDPPTLALKQNVFRLKHNRYPTTAESDALPTPLPARLEQFAERQHLLPQAWLFGMLFTYESTLVRESFLLGERYDLGHWYYFPAVMLFKVPLATLAMMLLAIASFGFQRRRVVPGLEKRITQWDLLCIVVPLTVYAASALSTNLNLGIRHILPIFPLLYLLLALRFASLLKRSPRWTAGLGGALLIGLATETLSAFPHYISFFNAIARPHRMHLLSDSNFDWGQDLPYVADWQKLHPTIPLCLGYWCSADPAFYGIRYQNLPGGYVLGNSPAWPPADQPAVLAVPATLLQGMDCAAELVPRYAEIRSHRPREILGDSIYLYDWPLR